MTPRKGTAVMIRIVTRAFLLAIVGLAALGVGYERGRAHDRDDDELTEPTPPNLVGTWTGSFTSPRYGDGTASLQITTQRGERVQGTITLTLASSTPLATSTAYGRISDSGSLGVESY